MIAAIEIDRDTGQVIGTEYSNAQDSEVIRLVEAFRNKEAEE